MPKWTCPQGFPFNVKDIGLPYARSHENRLVAVPEQVVDADGTADILIGPEFDAFQIDMAVLDVVQNGFGKAELRNAVPQDAAELIFPFKNRHIVAAPGQKDGNGNPGRAGTDNCHADAVAGSRTLGHFIRVGGRNVILDRGEMNRRAFFAQNAMSLALVLVIAD